VSFGKAPESNGGLFAACADVAIKKGFTFLGQTFRKHGCVLHITPSVEGVLALVRKVGTLIRKHVSAPMPVLIKKLNETLRGWGNYHRHVVASEAFRRIDTYVYEQLWRMLHRRHPKQSKKWLIPALSG
jgi:RNA-directed DNA polymerase